MMVLGGSQSNISGEVTTSVIEPVRIKFFDIG
jgi:hypothetical protein